MKRFALLALLGLAGCFGTNSDDGGDCWGLARTEQECVYQGTFATGRECDKLDWIIFDGKRLPAAEVDIQCGATDAESVIRILKPEGTDCSHHVVAGCVK